MNMQHARERSNEGLDAPRTIALTGAAVAVGAAAALIVLPWLVPALSASIFAPQPKVWWFLVRATGLVAFGLVTLSMTLGLLLSTRLAKSWPGAPAAFAFHQEASLVGLGLAALHGLLLLGDRHTPFTPLQVILPFNAPVHPLAVGLGQLAFFGMGILVASHYLRRHLGPRIWRGLHGISFAVYLAVVAHGVWVGSDRALVLFAIAPAFAPMALAGVRIRGAAH